MPKDNIIVSTRDRLIQEEKRDWDEKTSGLKTGFTDFDKTIDGLQSGLILVAGFPGAGKSSWQSQVVLQVLEKYKDVYWICFTLDDNASTTIRRLVANLGRVRINDVSHPGIPGVTEEAKKRRKEGYDKLMSLSDRIAIYDDSSGTPSTGAGCTIESIVHNIDGSLKSFKDLQKDSRVIITIDAYFNVNTISEKNLWSVPTAREEFIGKKLKGLTHISLEGNSLLPIVFATSHLRKDTGRPSMNDIKGSIGSAYDTSLGLLLYNDCANKREDAEIFFRREEYPNIKKPVLEINTGKSKLSENRGFHYFEFYNEMAYFKEVPFTDKRITDWAHKARKTY